MNELPDLIEELRMLLGRNVTSAGHIRDRAIAEITRLRKLEAECKAAGFVTPEGEVIGASLRKAINNQCLNEIDDAYRWAYREARLGYKPKSSRAVKVRYGLFPACMQAYNEGRKHGEEDFNKAQEAARKAGEGGQ